MIITQRTASKDAETFKEGRSIIDSKDINIKQKKQAPIIKFKKFKEDNKDSKTIDSKISDKKNNASVMSNSSTSDTTSELSDLDTNY